MSSGAAVADVLGVARPRPGVSSDAEVAAQIRAGLPVSAVDRVAEAVAPNNSKFVFNLIAKATLARRRAEQAQRLTIPEGEKVVRLAKVWAMARDVWKSDDAARGFLSRPHALLENRPPLDLVLETEIGGRRVEEVLGRLKYGSAA